MTDARRFIEQTLRPEDEAPAAPWYQMRFSLQALLLLMTMLAIASAVAFSFPPAVAALICIALQPCLVAAFIAGAFTAKSELRFFCIGALVPVAQSIMSGFTGGGNWGYAFALMSGGSVMQSGGPANSQPLLEYLGQQAVVLAQIGRPMMVNLLMFCFIALCCGFTAVWTRRFILKRNVEPVTAKGKPQVEELEHVRPALQDGAY